MLDGKSIMPRENYSKKWSLQHVVNIYIRQWHVFSIYKVFFRQQVKYLRMVFYEADSSGSVDSDKYTKRNNRSENSLVVQWLGLCTFTAELKPWSGRELRSCKLWAWPKKRELWIVAAAAAAAKSLQSCPTLCDPRDGSRPGSPVPGILQARTLEWAAISLSNAWKRKVKGKSLSRVRLSATPWTAAYQAPPSMGFSKQEYWSGVNCWEWLIQFFSSKN